MLSRPLAYLTGFCAVLLGSVLPLSARSTAGPQVLVVGPTPDGSETGGLVLARGELADGARVSGSGLLRWESLLQKELPPHSAVPAGGVRLVPLAPGRVSLPLRQGTVEIPIVRMIVTRGAEQVNRVALARALPSELLLPGIPPIADEAIRVTLVGPQDLLPPSIRLISLSPRGDYLDSLREVPLVSSACPGFVSKEDLVCAQSTSIRLATDIVERNHPVLRGRTILGEVGGTLKFDVLGNESASIRVGAPLNVEPGGPGRYRVRVRARIVRTFAGGPPAVGSDDAEAMDIVREEVASASRMWGQCGVHLGPPEELDIEVVDPPVISLLTVGCGRAVDASGGQIVVRIGGRRVVVRTHPGEQPRSVASQLASALRRLGYEVLVYRNAAATHAAGPSFDLLVRDENRRPVPIKPGLNPSTFTSDPTLEVCQGQLNLADGLTHFDDENAASGTSEERMLLRALSDDDPGTIELIVVPVFAGIGRIGESFIRSAGGSVENALILDRTGLRAGARSFTLAHELGHILLDMPGHPDDFGVDTPTSLMDADAADSTVFGPRRLTLDDCKRALAQSGRHAPTPLITDWRL